MEAFVGEATARKPYVISGDIETYKELNSEDPVVDKSKIDFLREGLIHDLEKQNKKVEFIEYGELAKGLSDIISNTSLPIVSLDRRYIEHHDASEYLDMTRGSDAEFTSTVYVGRKGFPSIEEQLDRIVGNVGHKEVALVDDVLFSGRAVEFAVDELNKRGVRVRSMLSAIALREGIEVLEGVDVGVEAVRLYEDVEDEICERDFTALPGSGKQLVDIGKRALYWVPTPYSDHERMASIKTEHIEYFFRSNLERNLEIFGEHNFRELLRDVFGEEFINEIIDNEFNGGTLWQ